MVTAGESIVTSIMAMEANTTAAAVMRPSMAIMPTATTIATADRTAAKCTMEKSTVDRTTMHRTMTRRIMTRLTTRQHRTMQQRLTAAANPNTSNL
jgi:hypothetical protein